VRRKEIYATQGVTSFIHVEDAAVAALQAIHWRPGVYNIVDNEPAMGTDWVPVFADALGAPEPEYRSDYGDWERGATNAKARTLCGWSPKHVTWRTGFVQSLS
jgi:nucleoside-diphosphate-sugar epimerase